MFRGKPIYPPQNMTARPTTDMAKEGMFNILENNFDLETVKYLDLFAGTGSICFEFLSRGCKNITAIDISFKHIAFIRKTSKELTPEEHIINSIQGDAFRFLRNSKETYDIIFCDPPYDLTKTLEIPDLVFNSAKLNPNGWLIIEHSDDKDFKKHPNFVQKREYGKVKLSIFEYVTTK